MDDPAKNSIWNYLIPLHYLEQVSSILERRGVEVSLTSHSIKFILIFLKKLLAFNNYCDIINFAFDFSAIAKW